ncbi:MAG: LptF/LptG family permease [Bacteroidia bacterium]
MKTIHRFTLKSFLLPFLLTFFIALFVLFMQFLWKWVDELVGKGLEWADITQLFFYASLSLVPLALPLAILLSSLMSFGNLAEHYELAALKASGLSLQRIMAPLILVCSFISILAFVFSNNVMPYANLKMGRLMWDIQNKKPALNIKEGVFYNGIDNYTIRVGKKAADGKNIGNVLIYDHTPDGGNCVISAKEGTMEVTKDKKYLVLELRNGASYEDVNSAKTKDPGMHDTPYLRSHFREETVRFDLSGFKINKTNEELFKENHQMLAVDQLKARIDTLKLNVNQLHTGFRDVLVKSYCPNAFVYLDRKEKVPDTINKADFMKSLNKEDRHMVLEAALGVTRTLSKTIEGRLNEINSVNENIALYQIEFHKKFALAFSCLVMFFIGAPLGAIIRKGGLGMPVVVSLVFFVIYWVITISAEKMAKEGLIQPAIGIWLSPAMLFPLGVFFTVKATRDSALFEIDSYLSILKKKRK